MKLILIVINVFLLLGCSQQIKHPTQLEHNYGKNISLNILSNDKKYVPKDKSINHGYWHYKQVQNKNSCSLFSDDQIVTNFYLAHNATDINITGNEQTIEQYQQYFFKNQVTANINLILVEMEQCDTVVIDYTHIQKKKKVRNKSFFSLCDK